MKKEHYGYVSEYFNLIQYKEYNAPQWWDENVGEVLVSEMEIMEYHNPRKNEIIYHIKAMELGDIVFVFGGLPTEELAEEILQYIKDTEILFI